MPEKNIKSVKDQAEIGLPQSIIDSFAKFLVPEICKFYESGGQQKFKKWQEQQEDGDRE